MIVDCFLDTNILVYTVDLGSPLKKREVAKSLMGSVDFGLSTQVLQEFYSVVTTKVKHRMLPEHAFAYVNKFMAFPVVSIDQGIVTLGIQNSIEYQISYWDGAIIAAAERLKCHLLYTEDLNHGQRYGSVEVRNPFK